MFRRTPVRVSAIHRLCRLRQEGAHAMIILGIVLLIVGYVLGLVVLSRCTPG
jgi:hypothetical protein